jgi:SAM-dependent methyltransferase
VRQSEQSEFDYYSSTYRVAVEESIGFAGGDLDFFTRAKAEALLEIVAERLGPPAERAFLDVGCGPGETDRFLEGRVGRLAGVDVASEMVKVAQQRNPWVEYRGFIPGDAIPFEEGSFDVCFAVCVLHHVPVDERVPLVSEMRRACRPGGLIAIFEHNPWNPLTRRAVRGCEFDRDAQLLSRREAARLLVSSEIERPGGRYLLFFTRESRLLRGIERRLGWLPLGAQYAVFGQRP